MEITINSIIPKFYLGLKWLIIVFTIYFVVDTVWALIEPPAMASSTQRSSDGQSNKVKSQSINLNALISRNLFGESTSTNSQKTEPSRPATVTKLPLTLLSVFASDSNKSSAAIIAQRDQPPKRYKIRDTLPGSAILVEIFKDKVILLRAGNREVLSFPKITNSFKAIKSDKEQGRTSQLTSNTRKTESTQIIRNPTPKKITGPTGRFPVEKREVNKVQKSRRQNVEEIQEFLGEQEKVSFNEQGGMVLDNGINSSYLRQTGLQEGDIVLSVNGRPASTIGSNKSAIQSILAEGSARIEVQRGSRKFVITASIPR